MNASLRNLVRVAGLKVLKATGRDIQIGHHWVPGHRLMVHSFKHKGYWWHGKRREAQTLQTIANLLKPGQTALDVGAHIGYFTTYFAHLAGPSGRVLAFEPSDENLRYFRANTLSWQNVEVEPRGVSNFEGNASFYVEDLTGQNNSLLADYQVFENNAKRAGFSCERRKIEIPVTTVDAVCRQRDLSPNFIKMDIEGAEFEALQGMRQTLASARPILLLELSRFPQQSCSLLAEFGYKAYDDALRLVNPDAYTDDIEWRGPVNHFFLPE